MKFFICIFTIITSLFSSQYTFLLEKYDKEIELEAKILFDIAKSSIKKDIKLFIPKITNIEKKVYSKYFILAKECKTSNFIFINKTIHNDKSCNKLNKLFFTNNYKKLLSDSKYYGAFFWCKGRPNIVFIKSRLEKKSIELPNNYNQYIENF